LASPVVEKALRCSSLLDPTTHYATPVPRLPHPSPELRIARDAAAAPGPVSGLTLVTACDTCRLGATTCGTQRHIRTRLLELTPEGEAAAAWLTECVPNLPRSVWPGASLRTRERHGQWGTMRAT
jgi:hypothetical protein